jgi:outer membrane lipoprotein carrier protein
MRTWRRLLALACGLAVAQVGGLAGVWSGAQAAADAGLDAALERLQATCAATQDLSAQFTQTVTNRSLGAVREGSGQFQLKRPGKMRWEYEKPEPRLFVTDGTRLWDYSPLDKQVRIQEVGQAFASRLPLAFLAGDCQVRREFAVSMVENAATRAQPNLKVLDLAPRQPEAGVARMLLEVDLKSGLVDRATLFDAAGNTTVIALSQVKRNSGLEDRVFHFTPPAGVMVIPPPKAP